MHSCTITREQASRLAGSEALLDRAIAKLLLDDAPPAGNLLTVAYHATLTYVACSNGSVTFLLAVSTLQELGQIMLWLHQPERAFSSGLPVYTEAELLDSSYRPLPDWERQRGALARRLIP